jgi:pyridoxine/pyridoxamine 5'-phosphate oxidase
MRDATFARGLIDGERFMTLATADGDGRPWASPVWFAHDAYRAFYWVSRTEVRHSRNIEQRAQIAIMVFDSSQTPGDGRAVYMEAVAARSEEGIDIFNARSVEQGLEEWSTADVSGDAPHRLYCASVSAWFVLEEERDVRVAVDLA